MGITAASEGSVQGEGGGAPGGLVELVGGGRQRPRAAGDAVGELVGVLLDPHGVAWIKYFAQMVMAAKLAPN